MKDIPKTESDREMKAEFVAEFTTNHMGNMNVLLRMVEEAAAAGASYIKMQKKDVENFYSKQKLDSAFDSPYGKTYREYRSIFEFSEEDFDRFDSKCKEQGVGWFATAQDDSSLDFLLKYDLPGYKVASSNARNLKLLGKIAEKVPHDKFIVISVAGSSLIEVDKALSLFPNHSIKLLHCVARYPCPKEGLLLGNLEELKRNFETDRIRVGYSGHEEGIDPSLAAVALGANMVERHFCLSRRSFVHHIECSLEPQEFSEMVSRAKAEPDLGRYVDRLPTDALKTDFGMTDEQRSFLVDGKYGVKFIDGESKI